MAKEHLRHFLEGQDNKRSGQSQNWTNNGWRTQWKKIPLAWHVIRMCHQRIPRQALHWEVPGFKRGPGCPRTNWRSTVNKDLLRMGIAWEEAEATAHITVQNHRMASECGLMHPLGCGLNQGQGQGQGHQSPPSLDSFKRHSKTYYFALQ